MFEGGVGKAVRGTPVAPRDGKMIKNDTKEKKEKRKRKKKRKKN